MATRSDYLVTGFIGCPAGAGIIHHAIEIFRIHARAWAAAYEYEALKRLSDADLAERGLRRVDLPRAAFHVLTERALIPARATELHFRRPRFEVFDSSHGSEAGEHNVIN